MFFLGGGGLEWGGGLMQSNTFFFSAVIKREKSISGNVLEFKDTAGNKQAERAQ